MSNKLDNVDDRCVLDIDISDEDFMFIALEAHKRDITFNQMIEKMLRDQLEKEDGEISGDAN